MTRLTANIGPHFIRISCDRNYRVCLRGSVMLVNLKLAEFDKQRRPNNVIRVYNVPVMKAIYPRDFAPATTVE